MSEIVSQLPPLTENFPPPIRDRISSGVSLGPFANGVQLRREERAFHFPSCNPARDRGHQVRLRWSQLQTSPCSETVALTPPASYTGEPPGSRCRSPHRSLGVLVPEHDRQRKEKELVQLLSLSSFQLVRSSLSPVCGLQAKLQEPC